MQATSKFTFDEVTVLFKLAIPLILTGFIEASVGFFSVLFLARLGTEELAAGAIVSWIFFTLMVILWGTLSAVSVLVSQRYGAKDVRGISHVLRDGIILALVFVIPASFLLWHMSTWLLWFGQDPKTMALAKEYMHALVWGVIPDFVGLVLLQFIIGLGHTRTNLIFSLLWVPLNIFLNYVFIYGKFGVPAFGMSGIGWGTTVAYWILAVALFAYLLSSPRYRIYFQNIFSMEKPSYFAELWQVGSAMGAMYCIEIGFFLAITLVLGRINAVVVAANQIVLQYLGELSVVTFSIAQAITVRMGHLLGDHKVAKAVRASYIGSAMAVGFMFVIAACYWLIPDVLIAVDLDMNNPDNFPIINYAKQLFAICAIFQVLEAVRFSLFGTLRAMKDTRFTLAVSLLSFWAISFSLGYLLAVGFNWKASGFWWAMIIGQVIAVTLLWRRFQKKSRIFRKRYASYPV